MEELLAHPCNPGLSACLDEKVCHGTKACLGTKTLVLGSLIYLHNHSKHYEIGVDVLHFRDEKNALTGLRSVVVGDRLCAFSWMGCFLALDISLHELELFRVDCNLSLLDQSFCIQNIHV